MLIFQSYQGWVSFTQILADTAQVKYLAFLHLNGKCLLCPRPHVCEHLSPAQNNVLRSLEGVEVDLAGRGQSLEFIRDRYTHI